MPGLHDLPGVQDSIARATAYLDGFEWARQRLAQGKTESPRPQPAAPPAPMSSARAGLVSFVFGDHVVRAMDQEGNPWFVLADACAVLGIVNPRDARTRLDRDETGVVLTDTRGGPQMVNIISEAGLYRLILRSDKPLAQPFQKWVVSEVIPTLRKTGRYALPGAAPATPDLDDPALLRKLLLGYTTRLIEAEEKVAGLSGQVEKLAPKAAALDRISTKTGEANLTDTAKGLGVQPSVFFRWCSEHGWLYRRREGGHWVAYQDKIDAGYLVHRERQDRALREIDGLIAHGADLRHGVSPHFIEVNAPHPVVPNWVARFKVDKAGRSRHWPAKPPVSSQRSVDC